MKAVETLLIADHQEYQQESRETYCKPGNINK